MADEKLDSCVLCDSTNIICTDNSNNLFLCNECGLLHWLDTLYKTLQL